MRPKKSTPAGNQPQPLTNSSRIFKVYPTSLFIKEAKDLQKKYPNIGSDFHELSQKLKADPITGNTSLGHDCYKIRLKITDKKSGERAGASVIVKVYVKDGHVYVLSVYDKSDKSNYPEEEFKKNAQVMS